MLKTLFAEYKWYAAAILFLVYSIFVWDTSAKLRDREALQDQVKQQEKFIALQADNDKLKEYISKSLNVALETQRKNALNDNKELLQGLLDDPRYKSCINTDRVRNAIKRKLDNQSK